LRNPLRLRDYARRGRSSPLDRRNDLLCRYCRRQRYLARGRRALEILFEIIARAALAAAGGQRQRTGDSCQADDFAHVLLQSSKVAISVAPMAFGPPYGIPRLAMAGPLHFPSRKANSWPVFVL